MNPLLVSIAAVLVILTVWGFVSPRGQWRVLAAWSRSGSAADEPGSAAIGLLRFVSGVGILILVIAGCSLYDGYLRTLPTPPPPPGPVEAMWGSPAPAVVDRVVQPAAAEPQTLVNQPVLGYQVMDGSIRDPRYLFSLPSYTVAGDDDAVGYIGRDPQAGFSALDSADLVVQLRGDHRCIPQQAIVMERADSVSIGVYYGQPNPTDGSNAAHLSECVPKPSKAKSTSLLLPIDLAAPLGDRKVTVLDGTTRIPAVKLVNR